MSPNSIYSKAANFLNIFVGASETAASASETTPLVQPATESVDSRGITLTDTFHFVRVGHAEQAEKKARACLDKRTKIQSQIDVLTNLLEVVSKADKNAPFEIKTSKIKNLLSQAKEIGVSLDDKKIIYSKNERDALEKAIERKLQNLDIDVKLLLTEEQECRRIIQA